MRRFGYQRRLRVGRRSAAGETYVVTFSTFDRRSLFVDLYLGRAVVQTIRFSDLHDWSETWAFVVMPDHVHWLFQLGRQRSLARVVGSVKQFSTVKINASRGRVGAVWQAGFFDRAIRREENLPAAARYIIENPMRSGLTESLGDYPLWDSVWSW